jgi:hypothetical protein
VGDLFVEFGSDACLGAACRRQPPAASSHRPPPVPAALCTREQHQNHYVFLGVDPTMYSVR